MHFLVKPDFIALHSWKRAICLSWVNERNQVVHCSNEEVQMLGLELLPQGFLPQLSMAASALQAQGWSRAVPCTGTEPGSSQHSARRVHGVFSGVCNRELPGTELLG